ncbi:hypothetical protein [Sinimarinibacterium flocculans]|uniref:hypothetical protein n=1 Tax=Sinimarinibacterium flocculans TaxID=985250 RepID=UPI003518A8E8
MPSSEHFSTEINEALRLGRAIPMLVDYRPPELPDHTLTVIGLIDGADFQGAFLPDDYAGEELVRLTLPLHPESPVTEITTDSADAKAIHELWSRWHGGIRESYLLFTRVVAMALNLAKLQVALEAAEAVHEASSEPAPKAAAKKSKPSTKRKAAVGRVTKRGGRPRGRK